MFQDCIAVRMLGIYQSWLVGCMWHVVFCIVGEVGGCMQYCLHYYCRWHSHYFLYRVDRWEAGPVIEGLGEHCGDRQYQTTLLIGSFSDYNSVVCVALARMSIGEP